MTAMNRRQALEAEIARDDDVVKAALCAELRHIFHVAHLAPKFTLDDLYLNVLEALAASRRAASTLQSLRISLRGNGLTTPCDSSPLPTALYWFRHRGNYHGAYGSLRELGNILRPARGIVLPLTPDGRVNVARSLHLRGDLWTYVHDKLIHVFARPGSTVDALLAKERPKVSSEPFEPPRARARPALRLAPPPSEPEPDAPVFAASQHSSRAVVAAEDRSTPR